MFVFGTPQSDDAVAEKWVLRDTVSNSDETFKYLCTFVFVYIEEKVKHWDRGKNVFIFFT